LHSLIYYILIISLFDVGLKLGGWLKVCQWVTGPTHNKIDEAFNVGTLEEPKIWQGIEEYLLGSPYKEINKNNVWHCLSPEQEWQLEAIVHWSHVEHHEVCLSTPPWSHQYVQELWYSRFWQMSKDLEYHWCTIIRHVPRPQQVSWHRTFASGKGEDSTLEHYKLGHQLNKSDHFHQWRSLSR